MTLIRSCLLAVAAVCVTSSLAAHADTFNFAVSGSADGYSGSGVLTTAVNGSGEYLITGITGTGVTGLIAPGGFHGNDNLLFPTSAQTLDANGFSFSAENGPDQFDVNVYNNGTGYFAFFRDEDNATGTLPITFNVTPTASAVPEPSTLLLIGTGMLGAAGSVRRKIFGS
ncbi:MAG TPA: PEP-CTERM sorting domain-containing protein [Edaphobacter sp.]|nr:PEP-CTERM sorting domain-containing protein [Edaphobacter sp.]